MKWQQPGLEGNEEGEGQVEGGKEGRGESIFRSTVEPVNSGFTVRLCERNSLSFSCPLHITTITHTCTRIHTLTHTHTMSFSHSAGCWQWLSGSRAWWYRTKALSLLSLGLEPTNARLLIRPYEWDWLDLNKRVQFGVHLCCGHFTNWVSSLQPYPQRCRKLNELQAAQWVSGWIMQLILLLFTANVSKKLLQNTRLNKSSVHLAAAFVLNRNIETKNHSLRMFSDNMMFILPWYFRWNWMHTDCCLDLRLLNA